MSSGKGDSRLPRDFTRHPRRRRFGPERARERATSLAKPLERFERAPKDVASARRSARALWCRDARASGVVIGERAGKSAAYAPSADKPFAVNRQGEPRGFLHFFQTAHHSQENETRARIPRQVFLERRLGVTTNRGHPPRCGADVDTLRSVAMLARGQRLGRGEARGNVCDDGDPRTGVRPALDRRASRLDRLRRARASASASGDAPIRWRVRILPVGRRARPWRRGSSRGSRRGDRCGWSRHRRFPRALPRSPPPPRRSTPSSSSPPTTSSPRWRPPAPDASSSSFTLPGAPSASASSPSGTNFLQARRRRRLHQDRPHERRHVHRLRRRLRSHRIPDA